MKNHALADLLPSASGAAPALSVTGLHYDSRKIEPGFLFFAVPGFQEDGAKYLPAAFRAGAVAAVVQAGTAVPTSERARCVEVPNVRRALAEAAAIFHGHPGRKLELYGVTGTKGKTSSTFLLESVLRASGKKTALVGGVECWHPGRRFASKLTTLESLDLQAFLAEAVAAGAEACVMEVSSHALSLDRVWGCSYHGILFTNLYEDHLDFYPGMEDYFRAKEILFRAPYRSDATFAVTNLDNVFGARLRRECPGRWFTVGKAAADARITQESFGEEGICFHLEGPSIGSLEFRSQLFGAFNLHNAAGVAALALGAGVAAAAVQRGIAELPAVPGRIERVPTSLPFSVFVDYAHMGPALENVLTSLRPFCRGRLLLVVGAGGDRPVERRTGLGAAAGRLADLTYITSDNPRTEDPAKIIAAVERAFRAAGGRNCVIEPDRRAAIGAALAAAGAGDIVCIAGKGHETGQIIGKQTFPFDDREEARAALRRIESGAKGPK